MKFTKSLLLSASALVMFWVPNTSGGLVLRSNTSSENSSFIADDLTATTSESLSIRATPVQQPAQHALVKHASPKNLSDDNGSSTTSCSFNDCCGVDGRCQPKNCSIDSGTCDVLGNKGYLEVFGLATPNAMISSASFFPVANILISILPTVFRTFAAFPTTDENGLSTTSTLRYFSAWGTLFIRNDTNGANVTETTIEISRVPPQQRTHTYYIAETLSTTTKQRTVLDTGFYGDLYDHLRCGPYEVQEIKDSTTFKQTISPTTTSFDSTDCKYSYAKTATAQYTFLG